MTFWNTIQQWAEQNTERYIYAHIPASRTDVSIPDTPLIPEESYFRVWLSEMYLAKSRQWFTEWYPAVQASVNLHFGDSTPRLYSRIVRAPNDALARGVLMNYPLTELIPFRGGIVEVEAALLAFKGQSGTDMIGAALGLLENFGTLVAAPLGQAIEVAQAVNKGIDDLITMADGSVQLSLHQAFVSQNGANALRGGFIAVILATVGQIDPEKLSVKENRLQYDGQPLSGYDYFLLQIERREERDDWKLSYIDDLMDKIANAYAFNKPDEADTFKQAIKFAVYDSEDFTFKDKVRVLRAIKQQIDLFAVPFDFGDGVQETAATVPTPSALRPLNNLIAETAKPTADDPVKSPNDLLTIF